jgi:hypothetical protein
MVYRFMRENQGQYTVREMAGLFGVSCSAYYQWAKQGVSSRREQEDVELVRLIREIVEKHQCRYGSPRARETLRRDYGKRASRKGNCWDNACAETFFKTLKRELETLDGKHAAAEVRQFLFRSFCLARTSFRSLGKLPIQPAPSAGGPGVSNPRRGGRAQRSAPEGETSPFNTNSELPPGRESARASALKISPYFLLVQAR